MVNLLNYLLTCAYSDIERELLVADDAWILSTKIKFC